MGKKGKQNRKKRKQARKLRRKQKAISERIIKAAKILAKSMANLPPRPHRGNKVLVDGQVGCIPFDRADGYVYCKDCYAKDWCSKEVVWIVTNGKFERRQK